MINKYLAKSDGTTLVQHSQDVIDAGLRILDVLIIDKQYWLPKLCRAAALHDFGKSHDYFQAKLQPNPVNIESIRHELISTLHCMHIPIDEIFAIATHHKGVFGDGNKHLQINQYKISKDQNNEIRERIDSDFKIWKTLFDLQFELDAVKELQLLKALDPIQQSKFSDQDRLALALMRALLISADHLASAGKHHIIPTPRSISIESFQPCIEGKRVELRSFQHKMSLVKGDALLHAPTGSGKTEAAMCWVVANQSSKSRLFYLLPYTASANAMLKRLTTIYGAEMTTALHSKTLDFFFDELNGNEKEEISSELEIQQQARSKKQLSKEIFYPVKVATPHQIIKNATLARGWEMCLLEYRNGLFIIDEFHTYNALLTGLIFATVKWLKREFDAKIMFMSATIPSFMQSLIVEHIFENDTAKVQKPDKDEVSDALILDKKRHILNFMETGTITNKVEEVEKLLKEGKKVLVIVNNVRTAQNFYSAIASSSNTALLHSGFNKKDRILIEKRITSQIEQDIPKLLVATQAVEVSLDIDYDCAFIENAPIDALIQRLGRVNRAGKKELASVLIIKENEGKTPFYDKDVCMSTWLELKKLENIPLSEGDLINTCNVVYREGYNEQQLQDFEQGLNNDTINNFSQNMIAGDWSDSFENVFENDNQKVEILCENLVDEYKLLIGQKRFIEANQLLVSVYCYQLGAQKTKNKELNVIIGFDFLYDSKIGYRKKNVEENQLL